MKNSLVTQLEPKSPISEAFRNLRTNVHYTNIDKEVKVIQITSSLQSEGKSTIVANYAVTLAQSGKRVLIIDCDLRRPNIHRIFTLPNVSGLTNVLIKEAELDRSIKFTKIENIFVLVAGPIPPNPSEMLESKRMKNIVNTAREHFNVILLDSPPVLPVTDALIISSLVDGTIVTIAVGVTERDAYKHTISSLENVGANIIGTVINKASTKERYYNTYAYEYKID
ncbi:MAG: CpsD/CapB family tyrosine-protein kinase [Eubacteriales bacterium]